MLRAIVGGWQRWLAALSTLFEISHCLLRLTCVQNIMTLIDREGQLWCPTHVAGSGLVHY
jgi:hypothetical protein